MKTLNEALNWVMLLEDRPEDYPQTEQAMEILAEEVYQAQRSIQSDIRAS